MVLRLRVLHINVCTVIRSPGVRVAINTETALMVVPLLVSEYTVGKRFCSPSHSTGFSPKDLTFDRCSRHTWPFPAVGLCLFALLTRRSPDTWKIQGFHGLSIRSMNQAASRLADSGPQPTGTQPHGSRPERLTLCSLPLLTSSTVEVVEEVLCSWKVISS